LKSFLSNGMEYEAAINELIEEGTRERRIAYARENSWESSRTRWIPSAIAAT
jgi:hypothetical protein